MGASAKERRPVLAIRRTRAAGLACSLAASRCKPRFARLPAERIDGLAREYRYLVRSLPVFRRRVRLICLTFCRAAGRPPG